MLNKPTEQNKAYFMELLGPANVLSDADSLKKWGCDWTRNFEPEPSMILLPKNKEELSALLAFCNEHRLGVVPSGGRTGLAGGAVAQNAELVVSLDRFAKIEELDEVGLSVVCEAGVITEALQQEAEARGLFFPLDLASKGSSQIGGNIATNAGGLKFIRFGGMREQVLGLEVVLADGTILDCNTNLRKNNTGYDLKQLFIGSEGTLGIITKASLKLVAKPRGLHLACFALKSMDGILELFGDSHQQSLKLSAFEFFSALSVKKVMSCFPSLKMPFDEAYPFYVLLEVEGEDNEKDALEGLFASGYEKGTILDGVIASSSSEFRALWSIRENITESLAQLHLVRKNDVALPIASLAQFGRELEELLRLDGQSLAQAKMPIEVILFGHIGDGNLHINYVGPKTADSVAFHARARSLEEKVFALVAQFRGSISAEHGIGLMRRDDLPYSRSPTELAIMQNLKKMLDPVGILNPGKIF